MIHVNVGVEALSDFVKEFGDTANWNEKCMRRAVSGEIFRLYRLAQTKLREGDLPNPERAPLTQVIAKSKGRTAMRSFMPLLGYSVREAGTFQRRAEAYMGFAVKNVRTRKGMGTIPLWMIQMVVGGHDHTITRADQLKIAEKLRRRRKRWQRWELRQRIPKVGRVISMKPRQVMDQIEFQNRLTTPRNVANLYGQAMNGQRWAREWWRPKQQGLGF